MNTLQINRIMTLNRITNNFYRGCFPSNQIPPPKSPFPNSFIINTEPAGREGAHWVALFIPRQKECYYFCSYALDPPKEIAEYLRSNFGKIQRNVYGFQSIRAKNCGKYCIIFCYFMSQGWKFEKFIKFISEFENSDHFVNKFFDDFIE